MLNYKIYVNKNKKNQKTYNKFYARAVYLGTTELAGMADKIQANCTVKKSDVLAVLTELAEVMTAELQESKIVKIAGLGSFKLTLKCVGADCLKDFSASKNIKKVNIRFTPEAHVDMGSRTRTKALVTGTQVKEYAEYNKIKSAPDTGDPNGGVVKP
jgi:predicted histone-like DNA-binding protein